MNYTFPPTKFVQENTFSAQIGHIDTELMEVAAAETEEEEHLELVDVYHSAETALRIIARDHGELYLCNLIAKVRQKNQDRNYYILRHACTVISGTNLSGCVMDEGRAWACAVGRQLDHDGKTKEACPHWREI